MGTLSGRGVDSKFALVADDHDLIADGADTTRVVVRVTDEFGAMRTYANDPIAFTVEGPVKLRSVAWEPGPAPAK